jgi:flagellar operon protein
MHLANSAGKSQRHGWAQEKEMKIESTTLGTYRIRYMEPRPAPAPQPAGKSEPPAPFARVLQDEIQDTGALKFSVHAQRRMTSREIALSPQDLSKLNEAVDKAAAKGSRDSLVLFKNLAFVVNIPHRTVITAIDEGSLKEHIFTNIDSAVLA